MNNTKNIKSTLRDLLAGWDDEMGKKSGSAVESRTVTINLRTDALALSVAADRMNKDRHGQDYVTGAARTQPQWFWTNDDVWQQLTAEDEAAAEQIRSYYGQQATWRSLATDTGKLLVDGDTIDLRTEYQRRFDHFMAGTGTTVLEEISGMIQRIPYFYELDLFYDELAKVPGMPLWREDEITPPQVEQRTLRAHAATEIRTRHWAGTEYWFATDEQGLASIRVARDDTLAGVMRWLYTRGEPLVIEGWWRQRFKGRDRRLVYSEPSRWQPV